MLSGLVGSDIMALWPLPDNPSSQCVCPEHFAESAATSMHLSDTLERDIKMATEFDPEV
jgi:hypothetical protein